MLTAEPLLNTTLGFIQGQASVEQDERIQGMATKISNQQKEFNRASDVLETITRYEEQCERRETYRQK
ncbi:MAG: hypothetical protein V1857_05450 [archaeon]